MNRLSLFLLVYSLTATYVYNQEVQFPIYNSVITFEQLPPEAPPPARSYETDNYWCAFSSYTRTALYSQLKSMGVQIKCYGKYPGGYVYHLNIGDNFNSVISILRSDQFFISLEPVSAADKIDERIWEQVDLRYIDSVQQTIKADIHFHINLSQSEMESIITSYVDSIIRASDLNYDNKIIAIATCDQLIELAGLNEISKIIPWQAEDLMMYDAREQLKVNEVQSGYLTPIEPPTTDWMVNVPLTGDSIWFWNGEYDISAPFHHHLDFFEYDPVSGDTVLRDTSTVKSTISSPSFGFTDHGTMTAAVAIGNGWASTQSSKHPTNEPLQWRGIAPKAIIIPGSNTYSGDVNNRSKTEHGHWYTTTSQELDDMVSMHQSILPKFNNIIVTGPGNNGTGAQYAYAGKPQMGYYSNLMESKNTISASSVEKYGPERVMAGYSSMGPTRDGRIKPDIMVPGMGFGRDEWYIEFDSIALVNNGTKYVWHFNSGDPTWGVFSDSRHIFDRKQENGLLKFSAWTHGWVFSDQMTPVGSVVSDINDTLVLRLRVEGVNMPGALPVCRIQLYWKRPTDPYAKVGPGSQDWHRILFDVPVNNQMYDLRIPIGDINVVDYTHGTWVTGDILESLRFDFVTKNWGIVSCKPTSGVVEKEYANTWGNSIAAPVASGIVALMLQKYRDEIIRPFNISVGKDSLNIHDNPMWNSTARGILIHTAEDMIDTIGIRGGYPNPEYLAHDDSTVTVYGKGPDWATGWGFVNVKKTLDCIDKIKFIENTVDQNDSLIFAMYVPENTDSLRTTLCWDDPEHPNTTEATAIIKKLINDLKLYMKHKETGTISHPWVIDHNWMHIGVIPTNGIDSNVTRQLILDNPAFRGVDTLNNVEVVDIDNPPSGIWEIVVKGDNIAQDQHLQDPIMNQDFSRIFDFPLIDDTTKTTWVVDEHGLGDFLNIDDAMEFIADKDNDTILVNPGNYEIDKYITASGNNCLLQLQSGTDITFTSEDAGIHFSSKNSYILGAENITLDPQIILYNTPEPRDPEPADRVIGLFAEVNQALEAGVPDQTTVMGPGEYNTFGHVIEEGLIGVLSSSDALNSQSNSIIRLGFRGEDYPDSIRAAGKLLMKDIRFEVNDDAGWGDDDVAGIWGPDGGEILIENCVFENYSNDGQITTTMFTLGRPHEPYSEDLTTRFPNCSFIGFDEAIYAWACTTIVMSPEFTNTAFIKNRIDLLYREGSEGICGLEANLLNNLQIGNTVYNIESEIQHLIDSICGPSPTRVANYVLKNPKMVDPLVSDFRLSPGSPLVDAGTGNNDVGSYSTDLIYIFSRFLDLDVVFDSKDTIVVENGALIKNTLPGVAVLKSKLTHNLRPIHEIRINKNFINNPSVIKVTVNNSVPVPSGLPWDYKVLDARINGIECASLIYTDMPSVGGLIYVDVVPDNKPPDDVSGVSVADSASGVKITWDANTESDLSRYKVYRYPTNTPEEAEQIASIYKLTTEYYDSTGSTQNFDYAVVAYDYTGNQSYSVLSPLFPLKVEMKDYYHCYNYKIKPLVRITNLSNSKSLEGLKIRVWFSREERPTKQFCLYKYSSSIPGIYRHLEYHPLDPNIAYVDIDLPETYVLSPGEVSDPYNMTYKLYFQGYPGMDKTNDWSLQGIDQYWTETQYVTIYDSDGRLIYGREFLPDGAHNHPPTGISLSDTTVEDSLPVGTEVGTFTAMDIDVNDSHTFEFVSGQGDDDNNSFTIDGNILKTNEIFNYNIKNTYSIRVRTKDSFTEKFEKQFTIAIKEGPDCIPGDGTMEECAYQLDGYNSEEVTLDLTGKGEYWLYTDTWPYMDDPWWTPNIMIYLNHADVIIPPMTIIVNGISYYYGGGWYVAIDIPNEGPYTIQILSNGGPFKFKLSN